MNIQNIKIQLIIAFILFAFQSCRNEFTSDASGAFETNEIIVSSQQTGQILNLNIHEGDVIGKGVIVGQIDVTTDKLKAAQIEASIHALEEKKTDPQNQILFVQRQLNVQQSQMTQLLTEKTRITNLLKADAATQKQLDDINASIDQLNRQIEVTKQQLALSSTNISTQNRSIMSEKIPLEKSAQQAQVIVGKGEVINPIQGTILTQYAYEGEFTTVGKALYKIANLDQLNLKAYITGTQLPQIQLGQKVKVFIDQGEKKFKEYPGTITWVSSKSEFTPKTIQTKEERANLVYAIKVNVKNDGFLKIGMYGELKF